MVVANAGILRKVEYNRTVLNFGLAIFTPPLLRLIL